MWSLAWRKFDHNCWIADTELGAVHVTRNLSDRWRVSFWPWGWVTAPSYLKGATGEYLTVPGAKRAAERAVAAFIAERAQSAQS